MLRVSSILCWAVSQQHQFIMIVFSVVIPTCNRNASLALCLEKLMPGVQTLEANRYEVIVSDDGKNNNAKTLIEESYPWARWSEGPKKGPAANRNNGAKQARGQWLVFTDDDCLPDSKWLQAYAAAIRVHQGVRAFEGAIWPDDWSLLKKDMAECPVNEKGGCFWSANIMVERKLFNEIAGFDEQFQIAAQEDQDLQIRLSSITNISFIHQANVIHPVRQVTMKKALREVRSKTANYMYFATKHMKQLGLQNRKQLAWHRGLKIQAIALLEHLRKKHWKKAFISGYNFLVYLPIYLKA